jgi:hypothetical protein
MDDRQFLLKNWTEADTKGLWAVPWERVLTGISAAQAAWKPDPKRHSIWQIVNHITFWREHELRGLAGEKVGEDEIHRRNFEEPRPADEKSWAAATAYFNETHRKVAEAIKNPANSLDRLQYLLPHDCYHVGQIMYLRAMQGLPSLET